MQHNFKKSPIFQKGNHTPIFPPQEKVSQLQSRKQPVTNAKNIVI